MKWNLAILVALQRDGRLSARDLASATGLSRNTAWRRKALLEAAGVILGYRAVIAPSYLSAERDVVVSVIFSPEAVAEAVTFETLAKDIADIVGLLRVGLNAYWVRVATREGLLQLESLARAQSAPLMKFDIAPIVHEIIPYRDPPVRGVD